MNKIPEYIFGTISMIVLSPLVVGIFIGDTIKNIFNNEKNIKYNKRCICGYENPAYYFNGKCYCTVSCAHKHNQKSK